MPTRTPILYGPMAAIERIPRRVSNCCCCGFFFILIGYTFMIYILINKYVYNYEFISH
mgnify:FL=1